MTEFLAILGGVFKFWDQVVWLVKRLEKTPLEKREALRKELDVAFEKFKSGDPRDLSGLINR